MNNCFGSKIKNYPLMLIIIFLFSGCGNGGGDSDDSGDDITPIVTPTPNQNPTSNAGNDVAINESQLVNLSGSGSDSDGTIENYLWEQTAGDDVNLINNNTADASFTAPATDIMLTLTFRLTVTDNQGAISVDDVTITVNPSTPDPELTANAGPDQTVLVGEVVTLSGSSENSNGSIASYAWTQIGGTAITLSGANSAMANFDAPAAQILTFRLTLTDSSGAIASDDVTVRVNAVAEDPELTVNAGDDQTVLAGETVSLSGSGSNPNGSIASYAWTQVGGTAVTLSGANSAMANFIAPVAQILIFRLTLTDTSGASASDDVSITVNTVVEDPELTANAGADQTVLAGDAVTLSGSGANPSGSIASYAWTQVGGMAVTLSGANSAMANFVAPDAQILTFRLTLTDTSGASASDDVTITVDLIVEDPTLTADAGPDQFISVDDAATLSGSGTDPNSSIVSYAWSQTGGTTVTLSGANLATANFSAPSEPSNLVFQLIVTNADGSSASDTVAITVSNNVSSANPILFVTQVPISNDFLTIGSTFGNHRGGVKSVGRGGDLWVRYPDGTLKNLTSVAGYGNVGFQGDNSIAVREPTVHWDGQKAIFSMVIGAPKQFEQNDYFWQIYEITGLGVNDQPVITKVENQPNNYNNISPIYGTDDRIIFTSDRPFNGAAHLYPQLDEYESSVTVTGLWSLAPSTGDLFLLNHAPSGNFSPMIDSKARVVFTQWDHLQQDQQADSDRSAAASGNSTPYGSFNYSDESASGTILNDRTEVFPEPREGSGNLNGFEINHFFPWTVNQDGSEGEVLLHLGRHELHDYFNQSFNDDSALDEFIGPGTRINQNSAANGFHLEEDPNNPQVFIATNAPEFGNHSGGSIYRLLANTDNADQSVIEYITHPDVADGRYRDPLPLLDGSLVAAHALATANETGSGLNSIYSFRLKTLVNGNNGYMVAGAPLTPGIQKEISFWNPDTMRSYSGNLWELNPVEIRVRQRPSAEEVSIDAPEQAMFDQAGVNLNELKQFMSNNNLALVVSRNVTTRDDADKQQPYNLQIAGGGAFTRGNSGKIYDIAFIEFFEGMMVRGYSDFASGRRVLARPMKDTNALANNPPKTLPNQLDSSTVLGSDGSMAAFVPARRAMTWQLSDEQNNGVVKERYWVTFQPGEVRVCTSCHGVNELDQAGQTEPTNSPAALLTLLNNWKTLQSKKEKLEIKRKEL